jgi:chemotaxis protein MotA
MVFGGYILAGGKMDIIMHSLPFEMMMIGGAATGAFVAANDFSTIKHTMGDLVTAFTGPKWKKKDYADLLCLMHELLFVLKQNPVDIEAHIEAPQESSIFTKYPRILKDHDAIEMICDTIRSMIMNFDNVHQVELVLEKHLESLAEDKLHGSHALQSMADALPALGIVAAVLGVIKTMGSIDKPPAILGAMVGSALVGTFLGVLLSYGIVGPLSARLKAVIDEDSEIYLVVRRVIIATLKGQPQPLVIESARTAISPTHQPSFSEIFDGLRTAK